MDRLERAEQLLAEFDEYMVGCGDVEYVLLNQIRFALYDYAEAMRKIGPGSPRKGYQEKELKL